MTQIQAQNKKQAQIAGVLYLLIAVVGGMSIGYMPGLIFSEGDASLTFQNLTTHLSIFKWGMTGDVAVLIMETVLTVLLYRLFKPFGKTGMTIATYSRFAMAVIMAMNLVLYVIPLVLIGERNTMPGFDTEQIQSMVYLSLKAHHFGTLAWQLFFSIHLFTLGYVLFRSGLMSKWLGGLMLVGSLGYFGDSFGQFLMTSSEIVSISSATLLVLAVISEFWFAFWLIIKAQKLAQRN
jgi:hypothetical protein